MSTTEAQTTSPDASVRPYSLELPAPPWWRCARVYIAIRLLGKLESNFDRAINEDVLSMMGRVGRRHAEYVRPHRWRYRDFACLMSTPPE